MVTLINRLIGYETVVAMSEEEMIAGLDKEQKAV